MTQKSKDFIKNFIKCFVFALVMSVVMLILDPENRGVRSISINLAPEIELPLLFIFVENFIINFIIAIPLTKWLHWR